VPDVLLSGHHGKIARWRRDQALRRTAELRPDLLDRLDPAALDEHDLAVLAQLGWHPATP
jgi:tRNA (guanine37-N1)-methyltransferase